ncbi:YrpD family protein [Paenibacillus kandeliae]|uniref:YrpD family protein n=1 Tax=Paenibacillus kandeliae TaxID=3231269 RepID=UPI0034596F22
MRKKRTSFILALITFSCVVFPFPLSVQASQQSATKMPLDVTISNPYGVSESNIDNVLSEIKTGIEQDKAQNNQQVLSLNKITDKNTTKAIYNYIVLDSSYVYSYEESPNQNPQLNIQKVDLNSLHSIENLPTVSNNTYANTISPTSLAASNPSFVINDGIGGRQSIKQSGGYLSTMLHLPSDSQVQEEIAAYNYSGFSSGNYEADMGLLYDSTVGPGSTSKGWKPSMVVKKGTTVVSPSNLIAGYSSVQSANAYASDSDVVLYVWHNYEGKARMKITGTAICADQSCSHSQKTSLTTIMETASSSLNIADVESWKLLSTVVSSSNKGKNKAIYSSIKIDGNPVSSLKFDTPLTEKATITRDSNNTVTITVSG